MVYRFFILIFFVGIKIGYSNIIYDKNEIIITDIEINNYKDIYKLNIGTNISDNKAIKNIVLIKKTLKFLSKNNPNYIAMLDKDLELEHGKEIFNNLNILNFMRFQKIRNEFISEYFQNTFSMEELGIVFANFENLELPLSKNNCLTIVKLHDIKNDQIFIESFFKGLKVKNQKIKTSINNELFEVCLNNKIFKNIESEIVKFIENKTQKNFDKFIYRNINWKKNSFLLEILTQLI